MKRVLLVINVILLGFLVACKTLPPNDNTVDSLTVFSGVEDESIIVGSIFDPLFGVTASNEVDGDITSDIFFQTDLNPDVIGTYQITYTVVGSDGIGATVIRTITVFDYDYVSGVFNYTHADSNIKATFMAAAEKYLLTNLYGGIPMYSMGKHTAYSDRFIPILDDYIPIIGYGIFDSSLSSDDSTVLFLNGTVGNPSEYTLRTTFGYNLWGYSPYEEYGSSGAELFDRVYGKLYDIEINSNENGIIIDANLASGDPIPVNPYSSESGVELANTWQIPIRDDLLWFFHPDTPQSFLNSGYDNKITSEDYVDTVKLGVDEEWYVMMEQINITFFSRIVGLFDYKDGLIDWDEVGIRSLTNNSGKDVLELEFEVGVSMSELKNQLLYDPISPINTEYYEYLDSIGVLYGSHYTNTAYSGEYYIDGYVEDEYVHVSANPNYFEESNYDGILYSIISDYNIEEIQLMFKNGYLDIASINQSFLLEEGHQDVQTMITPSTTIQLLNINRINNQDEFNQLFPDSSWELKPILSNQNFINAMYYAIDRNMISEEIYFGSSPEMGHLNSSYLLDVDSGVAYRDTLLGQNVLDEFSQGTMGYDTSKAHELFKDAIDELIESGELVVGTSSNPNVISLQLNIFEDNENQLAIAEFIESSFETLFVDTENFVEIDIIINQVGFPDLYFDYIMTGEYDLSFGAISGNVFSLSSFFSRFSSDNRSGFLLNYGTDTSVAEIKINYTDQAGIEHYEMWSFDAISEVLAKDVILFNGEEVPEVVVEYSNITPTSFDFDLINCENSAVICLSYTLEEYDIDSNEYSPIEGYTDIMITSNHGSISGLKNHFNFNNNFNGEFYQGDYIIKVTYAYVFDVETTYQNDDSNYILTSEILSNVDVLNVDTTSITYNLELNESDRQRSIIGIELFELGDTYQLVESPIIDFTELEEVTISSLTSSTYYYIKITFDDGLFTYLEFNTESQE